MAQDWISSPLGPIFFKTNQDGLVMVGWGKVSNRNLNEPNLEATRIWLVNYFAAKKSPLPKFKLKKVVVLAELNPRGLAL